MKLRFDLVSKVTPEMIMKSVIAHNHRYRPEPLLSLKGTGSLTPATPEDIAMEEELLKATALEILEQPSIPEKP